jgi:hypothetical protein
VQGNDPAAGPVAERVVGALAGLLGTLAISRSAGDKVSNPSPVPLPFTSMTRQWMQEQILLWLVFLVIVIIGISPRDKKLVSLDISHRVPANIFVPKNILVSDKSKDIH